MTQAPLYAAVHTREFPTQALLRLRPHLQDQPCAVLEGDPPQGRVCSFNARARALGVVHGMTAVELDTIPVVHQLLRSLVEEASARAALLEAAGTFSPRVEECPYPHAMLALVDIAGTQKLFGAPAKLAQTLQRRIAKLGIYSCVSVSANAHAAIALARAISSTQRRIILPGDEPATLAPLPLTVLDLTPAHAETFALWGIETLGQLAALPENALIARIGQDGHRLLQLARGELTHLFLPIEPAFHLQERMELDSPVEALDSLLFVIGAMLGQLTLRAAACVLALRSVTLTLSLEAAEPHVRTLTPALPTNDRQLWLKLLQLDLEAHPPGAAVLALTLSAQPGSTSKLQLGLFSPQTPEAGRLDITLARIRAIVGEGCVGRAALDDHHRAGSFHVEQFTVPNETTSAHKRAEQKAERISSVHGQLRNGEYNNALTSLRQLRPNEPITLHLQNDRPSTFFFRNVRYTVDRAFGPWFSSGDWWSRTRWDYQLWDLIACGKLSHGESLCCQVLHDPHANAWLMAGLYD